MTSAPVAAGPALAAALWRRARFWLTLVALGAVTAVLVTALTEPGGRPLDPDSAGPSGSMALARLLEARGVTVHRTDSQAGLGPGTVVVAFPDSYSADQLAAIAGSGRRVVLLAPDESALAAASNRTLTLGTGSPRSEPGCSSPGPQAAGAVAVADAETFAGGPDWTGTLCYGGAVAIAPTLVVLGTSGVVTNERLADSGVAALAINAITADGTVPAVEWLLPGADATGEGAPSIWRVLPDWTPRAVLVLMLLGVVLAVWRGRRLGPVVLEPLPVIVRSAELVEGHGRLYERGHAVAEAAGALRAGARARLAGRAGIPLSAPPFLVADATARALHRPVAEVADLLAGPAPADEADLFRLATALAELERAAGSVQLSSDRSLYE